MSRTTNHEYEVEQVRAVRFNKAEGTADVLIKWAEFGEEHTSWERSEHASNASQAVKAALEHQAQGPGKARWKWEYFLAEPSNKPPRGVGWHEFDLSASDCMSEYMLKYCTDTGAVAAIQECVISGKWHYEIDVAAMKQTNVSVSSRTTRPIRCIPIPSVNARGRCMHM
jgi:hypothetical protein